MTAKAWILPEGDVHLRIWLPSMVLDCAATAEAVRNLVEERQRNPWRTIELMIISVEDRRLLSRLPGERVFLGP